jgi:hypothetical protein
MGGHIETPAMGRKDDNPVADVVQVLMEISA